MGIAALLKSKISDNNQDNNLDLKEIIEKKKQELEQQQAKEAAQKKAKKETKDLKLKYVREKEEQGFKQCLLFIKKEYIELIDNDIKTSKKMKKPTRSDIINIALEEKYKK